MPDHIRTVADLVKFRELLKSHYFTNVSSNICRLDCFFVFLPFFLH